MSAAGPCPLGPQGFVDAWAPIFFFALAMDFARDSSTLASPMTLEGRGRVLPPTGIERLSFCQWPLTEHDGEKQPDEDDALP